MLIWYCLKPETQMKLRKLLPKIWQPPRENTEYIITPMEETEEVEHIMRKAPASRRTLGD